VQHAVAAVTAADSVVIDSAGHRAAGRDWVVVDIDDDVTAAAIKARQLRVLDAPDEGATLDPRARAAFDQLAQMYDPPATPVAEPQQPVADDSQQVADDTTGDADQADQQSAPAARTPRPRSRPRRPTEGRS
jgi:hypothetical protein